MTTDDDTISLVHVQTRVTFLYNLPLLTNNGHAQFSFLSNLFALTIDHYARFRTKKVVHEAIAECVNVFLTTA